MLLARTLAQAVVPRILGKYRTVREIFEELGRDPIRDSRSKPFSIPFGTLPESRIPVAALVLSRVECGG
jgi:hypothetical protein